MQFPLNFVARQSVWALDNDADLIFLKRASRRLRTLLGLDHSPASVARIQLWLNKQRALRAAAGREIYEHEADGDTLMLLSFYLAEWIGRSVGSPPMWSMLTLEQGAQACVVNFPEDRSASLGMVKLPGIVAHAWLTEGADLAASLRSLINLRVLDQPDQPLPALRPDRDVVFRERAEALDPIVRSAMWSVRPPTLEHSDLLSGYFVEQRELFERGHFTCGGLIQANTDLFKPEYVGLRIAEVVYDPANMLRYDDLQALAQALQRLSETPAEVRMAGIIGGDLVGMSTTLEAIAAREAGMEVLGLSLMTNLAAGISPAPLSHTEVLEAGREAAPRIARLLADIVARMG